jgi:hypothetical protein
MNFLIVIGGLGLSLALWMIAPLFVPKSHATTRKNRVVQRTPRPRYWVEGNTVHQYEGIL